MSVSIARKGKRSRKCFVGIKPEFQQFMLLTVEIQPYLSNDNTFLTFDL